MKIHSLLTALFLVCFSGCAHASVSGPEEIGEILSKSDTIIEGVIVKAEFARCGKDDNEKYVFTLEKTKVWRGNVPDKEIKACGNGGALLLGQRYLVAGNAIDKGVIGFKPEGLYLIFGVDRYFRPITYDTPIVVTRNNRAYAVGFEDNHFIENLSKSLSP